MTASPYSPSSPVMRALWAMGLEALLTSSFDGVLILLQRAARMYAYGSSTLVMALLFNTLGFSDTQLGAFMTLTLLGDVIISLLLTLVADKLGRRNMLMAGAGLMMFSGVVFAISSSYIILLLAAIVGVISPSGGEIGPFRALEESIQAQLTPHNLRADIFAIGNMVGFLSAALGQVSIGWVVQTMTSSWGWSPLAAYRAVFWVYALCAAIKLGLTMLMSEASEAEQQQKEEYMAVAADEDIPLQQKELEDEPDTPIPETPMPTTPSKLRMPKPTTLLSRIGSVFPALSPESRSIVWKLCLLFILDNVASGLVPNSFVVYFFHQKFGLPTGVLGIIFSTTSIVQGISSLVAVAIAKQIGLVKTMVYTHLPSAVLLALVPAFPNVYLAATCLILKASIQTMDKGPRTAFTAQVVLQEERTSVMGFLNVVRTLGQAAGPWMAGWLSETGRLWMSFVVAGALQALYDFGILAVFLNTKPRDGSA